jgi:hypothetical protein
MLMIHALSQLTTIIDQKSKDGFKILLSFLILVCLSLLLSVWIPVADEDLPRVRPMPNRGRPRLRPSRRTHALHHFCMHKFHLSLIRLIRMSDLSTQKAQGCWITSVIFFPSITGNPPTQCTQQATVK